MSIDQVIEDVCDSYNGDCLDCPFCFGEEICLCDPEIAKDFPDEFNKVIVMCSRG